MDPAALEATLREDPGFVGATLRPDVVEIAEDRVVLALEAPRELQQHFGGPHAAIIFGLGETAAYTLLMRVYGDLVSGTVAPLVKNGQIGYTAIVRGRLLATATTEADEAQVRARFAERGSATVPVVVVFTDAEGGETARADYAMGLKRF